MDYIEKNKLAQNANEKGQCFSQKLSGLKLNRIREIRQIGLMIGIELKEKVGPHINALQKEGVLTLAAGSTVLRLLPPLTITSHELDIVVDKIQKVLSKK